MCRLEEIKVEASKADKLMRAVQWPHNKTLYFVLDAIFRVRRFIDFDQTIHFGRQGVGKTLRGKQIKEFLLEEPFIVQTWNPLGAMLFFDANPDFPQPVLIIQPPGFSVERSDGGGDWGKDFDAIGINNKIIIDDWAAENPPIIRSAGSQVVLPN